MNGTYAESGESMSLIVQKFGGSSVRDIQRLFHVAQRIRRDQQQGHQIVVVVSAQGKTTDGLIEKALEIGYAAVYGRADVDLFVGDGFTAVRLSSGIAGRMAGGNPYRWKPSECKNPAGRYPKDPSAVG